MRFPHGSSHARLALLVAHGSNQFLAFVNGSGWARACRRNGVCGELLIP